MKEPSMTTLTLPSKLPDILPQVEESATPPSVPAGPLNPSGDSPLRKSLTGITDQSNPADISLPISHEFAETR
jgi:hypothetical protein